MMMKKKREIKINKKWKIFMNCIKLWVIMYHYSFGNTHSPLCLFSTIINTHAWEFHSSSLTLIQSLVSFTVTALPFSLTREFKSQFNSQPPFLTSNQTRSTPIFFFHFSWIYKQYIKCMNILHFFECPWEIKEILRLGPGEEQQNHNHLHFAEAGIKGDPNWGNVYI